MALTNFKNLPKGFAYPITKKEVREWLESADIDAEVLTFSYAGTGEGYWSKDSPSSTYFVFDITAVPDELNWHFTIKILGLKHERYEDRREELSQTLLAQTRNWICSKLALPATAPKKPCRATLSFNLADKDIVHIEEEDVYRPKGCSSDMLVGF